MAEILNDEAMNVEASLARRIWRGKQAKSGDSHCYWLLVAEADEKQDVASTQTIGFPALVDRNCEAQLNRCLVKMRRRHRHRTAGTQTAQGCRRQW
jgi:hypothetical protein